MTGEAVMLEIIPLIIGIPLGVLMFLFPRRTAYALGEKAMTTEPEPLTMFQYLLRMHKDGKVLLEMSLNVPIEAFPAVKLDSLKILETILVEYGKKQGFKRNEEVAP